MEVTFKALIDEAVTEAAGTEGWDFSFLEGRRHSEAPPWSYEEVVLSHLSTADSALDMDTGGGERLLAIYERAVGWPRQMCATESYTPNVPVAKRNLGPIGVQVEHYTDSEALPFGDESFDLIINRHGQYSPGEISRLLPNGGVFVTEQVGSDMCTGLNRALGAPVPNLSSSELTRGIVDLEASGFGIMIQQEYRGYDIFDDVGAIVWYLTIVPWQVQDFSVDAYADRLLALHKSIENNGSLDARNHHFFLVARKHSSTQAGET